MRDVQSDNCEAGELMGEETSRYVVGVRDICIDDAPTPCVSYMFNQKGTPRVHISLFIYFYQFFHQNGCIIPRH